MDPSPPAGPDALSFAVAYQELTDAPNPDLRGQGRLAIHPAGPSYRFTGETRAVSGRPAALEFHPDEIRNVSVSGRKVEFTTPVGIAGRKRRPFVFYCSTPSEAATVASLLPAARDADFVTHHDFRRRLFMLPAARSPWTSVTNLIVLANLAAFVAMGAAGAGWIQPEDMRPYVRYVANNGGATTDGEWWRIVSSLFVHYGLLHLLLNLWALFQTGHFVERLFGRRLFALGYLGSGIVASFTSIYWYGDRIWSAGASGAVFGVYGLLLGFMLREKQSIPKSVLRPLLSSTLLFAGYNLVFGAVHPRIDNAAHLGGLLGGAVLGWLLALPLDREVRTQRTGGRLVVGSLVLAGTAVLAAAFAPRFDYRFREELALLDALNVPAKRESVLLRKRVESFSGPQTPASNHELARWLETELIPFYETWRAELTAVPLTAGLRTDRNRHQYLAALDGKLAEYRRVVAEIRAAENDAPANPSAAKSESNPQS